VFLQSAAQLSIGRLEAIRYLFQASDFCFSQLGQFVEESLCVGQDLRRLLDCDWSDRVGSRGSLARQPAPNIKVRESLAPLQSIDPLLQTIGVAMMDCPVMPDLSERQSHFEL